MARKHLTFEDLGRVYAEIAAEMEGENDRAAIIVAGSILENALQAMLTKHLRPPASSKEKRKLFSEEGIISTFSQKIWLAYFMNLIGPSTRRNLDLIRDIRNEAAHNLGSVSFASPQISRLCQQFEPPKYFEVEEQMPLNSDFKLIFLSIVKFMTIAIYGRSIPDVLNITNEGVELIKNLDN